MDFFTFEDDEDEPQYITNDDDDVRESWKVVIDKLSKEKETRKRSGEKYLSKVAEGRKERYDLYKGRKKKKSKRSVEEKEMYRRLKAQLKKEEMGILNSTIKIMLKTLAGYVTSYVDNKYLKYRLDSKMDSITTEVERLKDTKLYKPVKRIVDESKDQMENFTGLVKEYENQKVEYKDNFEVSRILKGAESFVYDLRKEMILLRIPYDSLTLEKLPSWYDNYYFESYFNDKKNKIKKFLAERTEPPKLEKGKEKELLFIEKKIDTLQEKIEIEIGKIDNFTDMVKYDEYLNKSLLNLELEARHRKSKEKLGKLKLKIERERDLRVSEIQEERDGYLSDIKTKLEKKSKNDDVNYDDTNPIGFSLPEIEEDFIKKVVEEETEDENEVNEKLKVIKSIMPIFVTNEVLRNVINSFDNTTGTEDIATIVMLYKNYYKETSEQKKGKIYELLIKTIYKRYEEHLSDPAVLFEAIYGDLEIYHTNKLKPEKIILYNVVNGREFPFLFRIGDTKIYGTKEEVKERFEKKKSLEKLSNLVVLLDNRGTNLEKKELQHKIEIPISKNEYYEAKLSTFLVEEVESGDFYIYKKREGLGDSLYMNGKYIDVKESTPNVNIIPEGSKLMIVIYERDKDIKKTDDGIRLSTEFKEFKKLKKKTQELNLKALKDAQVNIEEALKDTGLTVEEYFKIFGEKEKAIKDVDIKAYVKNAALLKEYKKEIKYEARTKYTESQYINLDKQIYLDEQREVKGTSGVIRESHWTATCYLASLLMLLRSVDNFVAEISILKNTWKGNSDVIPFLDNLNKFFKTEGKAGKGGNKSDTTKLINLIGIAGKFNGSEYFLSPEEVFKVQNDPGEVLRRVLIPELEKEAILVKTPGMRDWPFPQSLTYFTKKIIECPDEVNRVSFEFDFVQNVISHNNNKYYLSDIFEESRSITERTPGVECTLAEKVIPNDVHIVRLIRSIRSGSDYYYNQGEIDDFEKSFRKLEHNGKTLTLKSFIVYRPSATEQDVLGKKQPILYKNLRGHYVTVYYNYWDLDGGSYSVYDDTIPNPTITEVKKLDDADYKNIVLLAYENLNSI